MIYRLLTAACLVAGTVATSVAASAATYNEVDDAGQTLATAQDVGANVDVIRGRIQSAADEADLYYLLLPKVSSFSAEVTYFTAPGSDSILYLFDGNGAGIVADDDISYPDNRLSKVSVFSGLGAGAYYLAITHFNALGALDGSGNVWDGLEDSNAPPPPDFTTLADFFSSPVYPIETGSYEIRLSVATVSDTPPTPVPAPAALPLFLTAAAGLFASTRRRLLRTPD